MLDDQLAEHGQTVTLRKGNTAVGQVEVKGFVRGFKPDEIVGIIQAGDTKITISPKGIETFGIPPVAGYVLVGDRAPQRIVSATPFYIGGELVRVDLQVKG